MTDVLSELRSVDRRTDGFGRGPGASSRATTRPDRQRTTPSRIASAAQASPGPGSSTDAAGAGWAEPRAATSSQATALCDDHCPYCWGPESD